MKTKLVFAFLVISLLGALLIGCGTPAITSRRAGDSGEGFVYRLPVGKIHILAIRQDVIYTNSQQTIFATNANFVSINQSHYQAPNLPQTLVSSQSRTLTASGTNGFTQSTTNFNLSTNYTSSSIPQITTNSLIGKMTVTITSPPPSTETKYLYNIAIDVEYYPDPAPSAKIFAEINKNEWYDQNWGLSGNNQLLSFVGTTNTDETGNVIAQAIQSAASIAELVGSGIPIPSNGQYSYEKKRVPPAQIEVLFDPFNSHELKIAEQKLRKGGITLNRADFSQPGPVPLVPRKKIDGVFYRALTSYQLELSDMNDNQITKTILLPDKFSLYHVKIDKWPLVTSSVQVSMNNGTLVGYSVQKPSQVEGGVELIPNTISTLVSPASQLLSNLLSIKEQSAATQQSSAAAQESSAAANSAVLGYAVTNVIYQQELQQLQSSNSAAR